MNENKTEQVVETKKRKRINRKWRYGTASTVLTIIVIAGVVLLNVVAGILEQRYPLNLDLTADDTFTISDKSRELAADVTEEVEVVVFQDESYYRSPDLGNDDLNTIARQFYEAMKQLSTASGGRIRTRYINFADNPTLVAQYKDYEVAEDSILFICDKRHGVTSLMNMFNYDQQMLMYYGALQVTESLVEQNIATNLLKVTGNLAPVVVLTGHGEDPYTVNDVKTVLQNNAYSVVECDLTKTDKIEDAADAITMVIPGPTVDYSKEEIVTIRDWLQQGGEYSRNLVVITDYRGWCPNLYELVNEEFGIEVTQELIRETKSYYNSAFAAYGDIGDTEFTAELSGQQVLSPYTQRLILHKENNPDLSLYNTPLVTFSNSAQLVDLTETDPSKAQPYNAETYPLVGVAYAHKQVPSPTTNEQAHAYVMVVGSSYFLDSITLPYIEKAQNVELFVSTFNEVTGSDSSVVISGRAVDNTLLAFENSTAKWLGYGLLMAFPVLTVVAIGLIIFLRRRHL